MQGLQYHYQQRQIRPAGLAQAALLTPKVGARPKYPNTSKTISVGLATPDRVSFRK
jgi:hypothetical protein